MHEGKERRPCVEKSFSRRIAQHPKCRRIENLSSHLVRRSDRTRIHLILTTAVPPRNTDQINKLCQLVSPPMVSVSLPTADTRAGHVSIGGMGRYGPINCYGRHRSLDNYR
jgi:hypothetical protein